jgi:hypothetical protein
MKKTMFALAALALVGAIACKTTPTPPPATEPDKTDPNPAPTTSSEPSTPPPPASGW